MNLNKAKEAAPKQSLNYLPKITTSNWKPQENHFLIIKQTRKNNKAIAKQQSIGHVKSKEVKAQQQHEPETLPEQEVLKSTKYWKSEWLKKA